jgi:hypothetical protein
MKSYSDYIKTILVRLLISIRALGAR